VWPEENDVLTSIGVLRTANQFGSVNLIHYVTSKAGVIGFTRSLARELGEFNINVNCIAPGLTISTE
jgi:NAD(P)-dependent dehydrogenase (short-subunit alcohol dehydrogenase family)